MPSENTFNNDANRQAAPANKTVDLKGVAAFVGLVELLAQELGTQAGKIQGLIPNGPATFNQLVGEIAVTNQGFHHIITLFTEPNAALKMHFQCYVQNNHHQSASGITGGVQAQIVFDASVEQILPQGRALARHLEDMLSVLDRMVAIGQSGKLSNMSISQAELDAFEYNESNNLVRNYTDVKAPKASI
jgi:hypothetical protein